MVNRKRAGMGIYLDISQLFFSLVCIVAIWLLINTSFVDMVRVLIIYNTNNLFGQFVTLLSTIKCSKEYNKAGPEIF
jgi:hypothetical protein